MNKTTIYKYLLIIMLLCVRQANGMTDTPTLQELLNEQETLTMITTSNDDTFTQ